MLETLEPFSDAGSSRHWILPNVCWTTDFAKTWTMNKATTTVEDSKEG